MALCQDTTFELAKNLNGRVQKCQGTIGEPIRWMGRVPQEPQEMMGL